MGTVVLSLDAESARDLYNLLHEYGEHVAAGAPLSKIPSKSMQRLVVVFRDLQSQLGIESMAEAMQRALDEKSKP